MDDSLGGMFKLTGSNYSVWKSKMRDMLMVKDLWDMGGNAHEDNCLHPVFHRHERV